MVQYFSEIANCESDRGSFYINPYLVVLCVVYLQKVDLYCSNLFCLSRVFPTMISSMYHTSWNFRISFIFA